MINSFNGFTQPNLVKFHKASLWVQFHNMPLVGMNQDCGEKIGRYIGVVEAVEVVDDDDDVGWGNFLRVKTLMVLTKNH